VSHVWLTVAASEYGCRACCACASTTTAAPSERRRALGDFFAVGHGFERPSAADGARELGGTLAQQLLPMPFRGPVGSRSRTRGDAASPTSTTTWTGRSSPRCPRARPTSTPGTAGPARAPRRLALRDPERPRPRHYVGTVMSVSRPRPAGSARATISSTWTGKRSPRSRVQAARTTSTTRGGCTWTRDPTPGCRWPRHRPRSA